jgi:hypothetical protein
VTRSLLVALLTLLALMVAVATFLDTAQGAVQTVTWACRTLGAERVAIAGAFLAGGAFVHAAHCGVAARRRCDDAQA